LGGRKRSTDFLLSPPCPKGRLRATPVASAGVNPAFAQTAGAANADVAVTNGLLTLGPRYPHAKRSGCSGGDVGVQLAWQWDRCPGPWPDRVRRRAWKRCPYPAD